MITVPRSFREMPRWWHDEVGRAWLDDLPALVALQCREWGLDLDGHALHGSNALVVPVQREGIPLALRLSPPNDDLGAAIRALQVWDGRGVVELVQADAAGHAMLLERLDGTRTLLTEPLDEANAVLAELVAVLAVPAPHDAPTTSSVAAELAASFEREWIALGEPTPPTQLRTAVVLANERAAAPASGLAVNGDLHHAQVLAGHRRRWIVVDPVLLQGDPEYDLARILWTRLDEMRRDEEVLAALDAFVRVTGVPAHRARAWIVLRSMSYLLWGLSHGLTEDPPRCRRLLDIFA